jgi:hypothetical protein
MIEIEASSGNLQILNPDLGPAFRSPISRFAGFRSSAIRASSPCSRALDPTSGSKASSRRLAGSDAFSPAFPLKPHEIPDLAPEIRRYYASGSLLIRQEVAMKRGICIDVLRRVLLSDMVRWRLAATNSSAQVAAQNSPGSMPPFTPDAC